jgi:ribosomal protein S18 acetylase RimI-like enzyme
MASARTASDLRFEADVPLTAAQVNAAYGWAEWPQREAWRIEEAGRRSTWFTARTADDQLVGVARLLDDGALYASIWDVIVRPDWRRRGVGGRLTDLVMERCRDRRLVALIATPAGRSLYQRLGFVTESHGHAAMYLRPGRNHAP